MSGKMLRCRRWWPNTQRHRCSGWEHTACDWATEPKGKGKSLDYRGGKAHDHKGKGQSCECREKGFDIKGKGKSRKEDDQKGKGKGYQGVCWNCGKVRHKANECVSQRPPYAVEVEIVEEADVGGVWMIGNVEVETTNMKLKEVDLPSWTGPRLVPSRTKVQEEDFMADWQTRGGVEERQCGGMGGKTRRRDGRKNMGERDGRKDKGEGWEEGGEWRKDRREWGSGGKTGGRGGLEERQGGGIGGKTGGEGLEERQGGEGLEERRGGGMGGKTREEKQGGKDNGKSKEKNKERKEMEKEASKGKTSPLPRDGSFFAKCYEKS